MIFTGPFGALVGAGIQEATYITSPPPGTTLLLDKIEMENYLASYGTNARSTVESWANTTFMGGEDQVGHIILYGISLWFWIC